MIAVILISHQNYVQKIPAVREQNIFIYAYQPFRNEDFPIEKLPEQRVAKQNNTSSLKLTDDLPVLDGATALYPIYAGFVNAVYPPDEYDPENSAVLCSKTNEAFLNLLNAKADIIFCATPSAEQKQWFTDNGLKLVLTPIGKEAFVFFVNNENKVENLSIADIQAIYSGKVKNWKALGGANERIRAYQRPENSGSQTVMLNVMGDTPLSKPRKENVAHGMGDVINVVATYRNFSNAIGYSFLYFTTEMVKNEQIKLLSINSVYPSKETIQNDTYPFSDTFYAIYVEKDDMNVNIKPFIEWILSEQGQEIVEQTGYVRVRF